MTTPEWSDSLGVAVARVRAEPVRMVVARVAALPGAQRARRGPGLLRVMENRLPAVRVEGNLGAGRAGGIGTSQTAGNQESVPKRNSHKKAKECSPYFRNRVRIA